MSIVNWLVVLKLDAITIHRSPIKLLHNLTVLKNKYGSSLVLCKNLTMHMHVLGSYGFMGIPKIYYFDMELTEKKKRVVIYRGATLKN